jgi:hypothetical protein
MRKRIISLALTLVLLINSLMLSACSFVLGGAPDDQGGSVTPGDENGGNSCNEGDNDDGATDDDGQVEDDHLVSPDVLAMLDGKYSDFEIPREKLEGALADAIAKIDYALPTFTDKFPNECSKNNVYTAIDNNDGRSTWTTGFWTGILWHAYELTGDNKYKSVANGHVPTFYDRIFYKNGVNHHDMGFLFTPSCVASYKLDGNVLG